MTGQKDDLSHAMKGTAVLAACIVQTLNESDPSFQARFLDRLSRAYEELRYRPETDHHELELIAWTRELLTGFNFADGQGRPFLDD